jgi:hypothetical protein
VLSGRGLCDELITRPEESYGLWCVLACDLENLKNEEAMTRVGSQRHSLKKLNHCSEGVKIASIVCWTGILLCAGRLTENGSLVPKHVVVI